MKDEDDTYADQIMVIGALIFIYLNMKITKG